MGSLGADERDFGRLKNEFLSTKVSLFGTQGIRVAAVEGVRTNLSNEEKD
jgi:hypothetical protein